MREAAIMIAHGSRRQSANQQYHELLTQYEQRKRYPHPVYPAFIELAKPSVEDQVHRLAESVEKIRLLPLSLLRAGHVKNDLFVLQKKFQHRYPHLQISCSQELGLDPNMRALVIERLKEKAPDLSHKDHVLLVGRGSSDPDANSDVYKLARLLTEDLAGPEVSVCFLGISQPGLTNGLRRAAETGAKRILVMPYLLFAGRLLEILDEQLTNVARSTPWIHWQRTQVLGGHRHLFDLIDARLLSHTSEDLACLNCQYRQPYASKISTTNGLKALLWTVRHQYTHTQASPSEHTHPPLKKHVLICGNTDCIDHGSLELIEALRQSARRHRCRQQIKITRTSCLGRCSSGPTVVVYPDAVWYRQLQVEHADEFFREHLLGDRLLETYVDDIMQ